MSLPWQTFRFQPDEGMLPPLQAYGARLRTWHWLNALAIVILMVSGYFIGTPPPAVTGDTSTLYVMGWIRFAHLASGYIFGLLCVMRILVIPLEKGGTHQLFFPPFWRRTWLEGLLFQLKWNLLLAPRHRRYIGLNPLANIAMIAMFLIPCWLLVITGFAMYAEVAGHDSWQFAVFGWVTKLWGNTLDIHIVHRLCMWVLLWFVMVHVYIAVKDDITGRQTMISSMISGERLYRK